MMSAPIAVASATAYKFSFAGYQASVNVQVKFYTDAAGTTPLAPLGTGSRDITATNTSTAFEGQFRNPTPTQTFDSTIDDGTITGAVDGRWYEIPLGSGMQNVTLVAVANVTPGTAVSYRLIVDTQGSSEAA